MIHERINNETFNRPNIIVLEINSKALVNYATQTIFLESVLYKKCNKIKKKTFLTIDHYQRQSRNFLFMQKKTI